MYWNKEDCEKNRFRGKTEFSFGYVMFEMSIYRLSDVWSMPLGI